MKTTMFHGDGFLPFVGLGTCNLGTTEEELIRILNTALDVGYRLFDTANGYNNESGIGKFLHHLPIPRSEVFITSKLNDNLHSYTAASSAVDETLNRLPQLPYIVLFIILSLLFVPSTKPLLYSYATAFSIASISRLNPSAKLFSGFRALLLYVSTNKYNKGTFRFLNILRNSFIQQCSSQIFGYFS